MKVFIDPGHGGSDAGACANGLREKDINLVAALKIKYYLQECGFDVKLSREDDRDVGLSERCIMANDWGADYFISVHHNAGGGTGYEIIHAVAYGKGTELATAIGAALDVVGRPKHGIYSKPGSHGDYFCVIRETNMSSIITEYAYIDSDDVNTVNTDEGLTQEALAISRGVCNYLGVQFVEDQPQVQPDPAQPEPQQPHWAKAANDELLAAGIISSDHSATLDEPATEGFVLQIINNLRKVGK